MLECTLVIGMPISDFLQKNPLRFICKQKKIRDIIKDHSVTLLNWGYLALLRISLRIELFPLGARFLRVFDT